jgi:hypothetical protein
MHDIQVMTGREPLTNISEQSPNFTLLPRSRQEAPKVLPVESLLYPGHGHERVFQLNCIGEQLDNVWRVNRREQLNFPMCSGTNDIAL